MKFFYFLLLIVAAIFSVNSAVSSVVLPKVKHELKGYEELDAEPIRKNQQRIEYEFKTADIQKNGGTLGVYDDHWEFTAYADGEEIYSRKSSKSFFCRTTGSSWSLIETPRNSKKISVVFTSTATEPFNHNISFISGDRLSLYRNILYGSVWQIILGLILSGIGLFMIFHWLFVVRVSCKGVYILYFGIVDLLLGIWSILVSDFVLLECSNYVAVYFIGHMCLLGISFPLIMFTKEFY
ncbi:MAG: hypothetical protein K6F39_00745, partial [Lachnospiraceae bacterium]|nr:hypothetical protein [Lachnospiraceae bacterium]